MCEAISTTVISPTHSYNNSSKRYFETNFDFIVKSVNTQITFNFKLINELIVHANRSIIRHKHAAMLVFSNDYYIRENHYCEVNDGVSIRYTHHAEVACIMEFLQDKTVKERKKTNIRRACIIVIRVNNTNKLVNSKPCDNCLIVMKCYGIKYCHYSTADSTFNTIEL